MTTFDIHTTRSHFPTLSQPQIYFDNAGGSQILGSVADSIRDYLLTNNVQLGATYKAGRQSTDAFQKGLKAGAEYINAGVDEIALGPSTTQLFRNLSISLLPYLQEHPSPELVISIADHEANISPWVYLSRLLPKLTIKYWKPTDSSTNPHLTVESLKPLLSPNTALVTCTHASNILGSITPVAEIAKAVHEVPNAMLCVDAVAYAPHRPVDVKALGVDFYAFSWYKVFGPHIAQLYCARSAQDRCMTSLGHFFKQGWTLEEKLDLAAGSYELVQALPVVVEYLQKQGWESLIQQEQEVAEVLLEYLRSKPDRYRILGEPGSEREKRVSVISFEVKGRSSKEVVEKVESGSDFGFRWGHFYSKRLLDGVLSPGEDGVVRVSMLHYNSIDEARAFVKALDAEVTGGS